VLPTGVITLTGGLIPYSDVVTNTQTYNLTLAGGSQIQQWDAVHQGFNTFTYSALAKTWKLGTINSNPVVKVGEALFINAASGPGTNWVETLP
jgi:hypothetical protein